jgi:hypothetical protein
MSKTHNAFKRLASNVNPTSEQVDIALTESGINPRSAVSVSSWARSQTQNAAIIALQGRRILRLEMMLKQVLKDHASLQRPTVANTSDRSLPRKNKTY